MWYKGAEHFKKTSGHEVNGAWYPRVTRILEIKAKPALDAFFKEMESYASAEAVKNKSAEEGSIMHAIIQKTAVGEAIEISAELQPAVDAFQKLQKMRGIVFHPEFMERPVWSSSNRYAGTIDALASIDGKFGVLDIKTSMGFYPEYNLQTAAYVAALREQETKRVLALPRDIETRWILRVNHHRVCERCGAILREKGGRNKIKAANRNGSSACKLEEHEWGEREGDVELKEFPYMANDIKAFLAAKTLWEWDNNYWLRQIGYL